MEPTVTMLVALANAASAMVIAFVAVRTLYRRKKNGGLNGTH